MTAMTAQGLRMQTMTFQRDLTIPSAAEFVVMYPQYRAALDAEQALFDLITTEDNVLGMLVVTERTSLPAVSAVASAVTAYCQANGELSPFRKQFSGAVTCCVMKANGFEKTHRKRAVAAEGWSVGEVYKRS